MACPLQVCGGKECRHVSSRQGARPETWLQRAAWTLESTGQSSSSWQRENWWLASKDQGVTKKVGFNICPGMAERTMAQFPSSRVRPFQPPQMQLWAEPCRQPLKKVRQWRRRLTTGTQAWTTERRGCHRKLCSLVNNLSSQWKVTAAGPQVINWKSNTLGTRVKEPPERNRNTETSDRMKSLKERMKAKMKKIRHWKTKTKTRWH